MENKIQAYGTQIRGKLLNDVEYYTEQILINGFCIISDVLSTKEITFFKNRTLELEEMQVNSFGKTRIEKINDTGNVRAPLDYDENFLELSMNDKIMDAVSRILGEYFILHLQNAIINRPQLFHNQSQWHRDIPYQHFTSSKPLALSAFFLIDDFSEATGGTIVLPFSHKIEELPSEKFVNENMKTIEAKAGSVLLFDSMLFHRGGSNTSNNIRIGINNVYVRPFMKQQIDLQYATNNKYKNNFKVSRFLGYSSNTPKDVEDYRNIKINKV